MSHIPNSAMPHAGDIKVDHQNEDTAERQEGETSLRDRAQRLADKARERPGVAAAAGAAVIAGVAAAAALPLMRGWSNSKNSNSGKSRSTRAKKSS